MKKEYSWKRKISYLVLFSLLIILVLFSFETFRSYCREIKAEDFSKVERERSSLVLGLVSYMSVVEVKKALSLDGREDVVFTDDSDPEREGFPPYRWATIEIQIAQVDNFKGSLSLKFFNDRLMEARFYPIDFEGFAQHFFDPADLEVLLQNIEQLYWSESIDVKPFTTIWIYKDLQERRYIGWVDSRLLLQGNDWILCYL